MVQNLLASGLRLAHATVATGASSAATVGLYDRGGYQSTNEKDSGSNGKKDTFHEVLLLTTGLDGDRFMAATLLQRASRTGNCSEFVTR